MQQPGRSQASKRSGVMGRSQPLQLVVDPVAHAEELARCRPRGARPRSGGLRDLDRRGGNRRLRPVCLGRARVGPDHGAPEPVCAGGRIGRRTVGTVGARSARLRQPGVCAGKPARRGWVAAHRGRQPARQHGDDGAGGPGRRARADPAGANKRSSGAPRAGRWRYAKRCATGGTARRWWLRRYWGVRRSHVVVNQRWTVHQGGCPTTIPSGGSVVGHPRGPVTSAGSTRSPGWLRR